MLVENREGVGKTAWMIRNRQREDVGHLDHVAGLLQHHPRTVVLLNQQPENAVFPGVGQRQSADVDPVLLQHLADLAQAAGLIFHEKRQLFDRHDYALLFISSGPPAGRVRTFQGSARAASAAESP